MFGKPAWFWPSEKPGRLRPRAWQGWTYLGMWAATVILPSAALLTTGRGWESLIWLGASGGGLAWDVQQLASQVRQVGGKNRGGPTAWPPTVRRCDTPGT